MYILKIVGAVKGLENDMQANIIDTAQKALDNAFEGFGVFEILTKECKEERT